MDNWSYTSNPLKPCLTLRNRSATEVNELFHFETTGLFKARSFSCLIDSKTRTNVKDLDENVNLDKLNPKSFFNTLTKNNEIGFDVEEMIDSFPQLVDDCSYSSVSIDYNGLIPVLVKEVKELKKKVNELEGISTPSSYKSADICYDKIFQPDVVDVIPPTGATGSAEPSIYFIKPASFIKTATAGLTGSNISTTIINE